MDSSRLVSNILSYFPFHCCDKISRKSNSRGKGFILAPFRHAYSLSLLGFQGPEACCILSQEHRALNARTLKRGLVSPLYAVQKALLREWSCSQLSWVFPLRYV